MGISPGQKQVDNVKICKMKWAETELKDTETELRINWDEEHWNWTEDD